MAGKTVAEKLLIKPHTTAWVSDSERSAILQPLPEGATWAASLGQAAVAIIFADDEKSLRTLLEANKAQLARPTILWVAYPKANRTDINRDTLWPILTEYSMRPNGQVAVDQTWSALRFRTLKEGEEPFTGGRG